MHTNLAAFTAARRQRAEDIIKAADAEWLSERPSTARPRRA